MINFSRLKQAKKIFSFERSLLGLIIIFSWWLMSSTFGYKDGHLIVASRAWSDFSAHIPLIRSFSVGDNSELAYPQFANDKMHYHYLFYYFVAILEKIGLNIGWALNLLSVFGLSLMLWLVYKIGRLVSGRKLAGVLAVILVMFNSSLTYVDYLNEHWAWPGLVTDLFSLKEFVNFGPWNGDKISAFWHWNIWTNQRHLPFSFALMLVVMWPLLKAVFSKGKEKLNLKVWLWLIWGIMISLPFFNQAAYVMTVIFIVMWFLLNKKIWADYAYLYFFALLYSIPSFVFYWGDSEIAVEFGYLAKQENFLSILGYWLWNIGVYCLLWPVLLKSAKPALKKLGIIAVVYFVLANTFRLSADMINNHKLINMFIVFTVWLTADWWLRVWAQRKKLRPLLVVLLLSLTLSGVIDAFPIINDYQGRIPDYQQRPLGQWVVANTEPDSIFLTTEFFYHPVNLAGRKTYLDYGYFAWSLGYPSRQRRKLLSKIFASEISQQSWCGLMNQEGIDYLAISLPPADEIDVQSSWIWQQKPVFAQDENHKVFAVKKICF